MDPVDVACRSAASGAKVQRAVRADLQVRYIQRLSADEIVDQRLAGEVLTGAFSDGDHPDAAVGPVGGENGTAVRGWELCVLVDGDAGRRATTGA